MGIMMVWLAYSLILILRQPPVHRKTCRGLSLNNREGPVRQSRVERGPAQIRSVDSKILTGCQDFAVIVNKIIQIIDNPRHSLTKTQ